MGRVRIAVLGLRHVPAGMGRNALGIVILVLVSAAGCERVSRVPVMIDLERVRFAEVGGRPVPLQIGRRGKGGFVVQPGQALDVAVILPGDAVLRLRPASALPPAAMSVSVETRDGWRPLELRRFASGRVRAVVPAAEGPARLRFESRARRFGWLRARLVGRERQRPPALPRAARPPAGTSLNVIVYLVDALRADHLSLYGYARETTPRLAALAGEGGIVFENAYAAGPNTTNSIPSLFTSRYPSEIGVAFGQVRGVEQTMAEAFARGGYATAAFVVNPFLQPQFGFGRGFATYQLLRSVDEVTPKVSTRTQAIHAAAREWLAQQRSAPFFLYVHTLDVHDYVVPPAFLGRFANDGLREEPASPRRARPAANTSLGEFFRLLPRNQDRITPDRYDEALAAVDDEFGRFIAALGPERDHTVVVFTADHGEALGNEDDGSYMHGQSLHEELVHIPFVVLAPWLGHIERVDEVMSLLDVAPTLADLAGLPIASSWEGRSLARPTGTTKPPAAVFERLGAIRGEKRLLTPNLFRVSDCGIREGPWKLLLRPDGAELFDLPADPKETRDVQATQAWILTYLANRVWTASPALRDVGFHERMPAPVAPLPPRVDRQFQKALEALGYVE
jgi:arylsulfatase A-like enzyme